MSITHHPNVLSDLTGLPDFTNLPDLTDPFSQAGFIAFPDPQFAAPDLAGSYGDGVVSAATTTAAAKTVAQTMTLYLTETGNTSAISVSDINQGQLGDCYLLSSIGEIALTDPSFISGMIKTNTNGTESVTLYDAKTGALPTYGTTAYKATAVSVTNTFEAGSVNSGATQDVVGSQKEIWVQVLEKADATLSGGYSAIANGGNPMIAMEELTGQAASYMAPASLTQALLQTDIAAKDLIVMDTAASPSAAYGLVGGHAYMFESLTTVKGVAEVQLGNPWGFDQPSLIPLAKLASAGIVEVDVGKI